MNNQTLHHPLSDLLKAAPAEAMPNQFNRKGSPNQSYKFLFLMLEEQINSGYLSTDKIFEVFKNDGRSPRQRLEGDTYHHWIIERVKDPSTGVIIGYKLDKRHLSGDPKQDIKARRERNKNYKAISHKEATQGRKREPKAYMELVKANKEYVAGLGEAANDADIKKPLSD